MLEIVFVVKRHYNPAWSGDWRRHFTVDIINGNPGNELKCDNRKLGASCLRVGFDTDGAWRVFGLRGDFHPAAKIQMEDDITACVTVPPAAPGGFSRKFVRRAGLARSPHAVYAREPDGKRLVCRAAGGEAAHRPRAVGTPCAHARRLPRRAGQHGCGPTARVQARLGTAKAEAEAARIATKKYRASLVGTIGVQPLG